MSQSNTQQLSRVFRGTIDEVVTHLNEIPAGASVELKVFAEEAGDTNGRSLADALQEIGTVEGLPADLSTNPQYMAGFGQTKSLGTS